MKKYALIIFGIFKIVCHAQFGFIDPAFEYNIDQKIVYKQGSQSNGKILILKGDTMFSQNYSQELLRLNISGLIDSTFNPVCLDCNSTTFHYFIDFKVASNDKIILSTINSNYQRVIKRLNTDGSLDLTFNEHMPNSVSSDIIIDLSDNIYFSSNSTIVKLNDNGLLDTSYHPPIVGRPVVFDNQNRLLLLNNNQIYRLNTTGEIDSTFNLVIPNNISYTIEDIHVLNDDKLLISGNFAVNLDGIQFIYPPLFKLHDNGVLDSQFTSQSPNFYVYNSQIEVQNNGKILLGSSGNITRFNSDGSLDSTFVNEIGLVEIQCFSIWNNKLYVAVSENIIPEQGYFMRVYLGNETFGRVYLDIDQNCIKSNFERTISATILTIAPLNIVVETNSLGYWIVDSLPPGTYSISIDTSNTNWTITCPITQSFTVVHPDSLTIAPSFGMVANNPCPSPNVSVNMPFMRPCFTGQQVYVQACNEYDATGVLPDAYSIVALDPNLIFESASLPYTSLGNNQYRFEHDTLYPGQCVNYAISTQVNCDAPLGLTLCLEANLYPVADCVLDTIPTPPTGEVIPCTLPWDQSSLSVEGWCANDSIYFTITNTDELGGGNMECYSPVRVYVDGVPYLLDSIKLLGGETFTYVFAGNGATWILEADQHPLHPGNSHPNTHVENCNPGVWTPNLVNNFPHDDDDPMKDIYCGIVTGSYDPNDKKGTPYGLGAEHEVLPNQDIEYLIRFQNTGTDTAFTVVVRDTLDADFDIFSVTAGSASHNYSFRMYGPRVLEWIFSNILLPDSTTNEVASHGFLSYRVKQKPNLADGTLLTNDADIYFDFNEPIITNETSHKVQRRTFEPTNSLVSLSQIKTGIKLYPNPTKQETTLSFSTYQKQISYKLMNLSGQVVLEKANLYGKEVKVNLSDIPNGMYLMELKTTQGNEIVKVVKE